MSIWDLGFLYTSRGTTVKFYLKIHVSCILLHIQIHLFIHYSLAGAVTDRQYNLLLNNAKLFPKFKISWCHSCRTVKTARLAEASYLFKK